MEVNKVETADGEVLIDLTADTVTEEDVNEGITFHGADGVARTGTAPDKMPYISGKTPILLTDAEEAYSKETVFPYAAINSIGGKSVVWNQIAEYSTQNIDTNGIKIIKEPWHIVINVGEATGYAQLPFSKTIKIISGHRYLFMSDKQLARGIEFYVPGMNGIRGSQAYPNNMVFINNANESYLGNQPLFLYVDKTTAIGDYEYYVVVSDLTAMFGAGNEPTTTSDPRIAWIEAYAEAHPEYNSGEIVSAEVERIITNSVDGLKPQFYPIPEAIRQLDGYGVSMLDGSACNTVDYKNKTYTQNCYVDGLEVKMLETPIITDLSAILTDDFLIECESGGTVTFGNESELSIPNEVEYITEADFAKRKANKIDVLKVDNELSETSENPVQNKVITAALQNLPTGGLNFGTVSYVGTGTDIREIEFPVDIKLYSVSAYIPSSGNCFTTGIIPANSTVCVTPYWGERYSGIVGCNAEYHDQKLTFTRITGDTATNHNYPGEEVTVSYWY